MVDLLSIYMPKIYRGDEKVGEDNVRYHLFNFFL